MLTLGSKPVPFVGEDFPSDVMSYSVDDYSHAYVSVWQHRPGAVCLVIGANPANACAHRFNGASLEELALDLLDLARQLE